MRNILTVQQQQQNVSLIFFKSSWNTYITDNWIPKTSVKKINKKLTIIMEIENTLNMSWRYYVQVFDWTLLLMFLCSETVDFPNGIIDFGSLWRTILISRKIDAVLQFLLAGWMILGSKSSIWQKICPYLQVLCKYWIWMWNMSRSSPIHRILIVIWIIFTRLQNTYIPIDIAIERIIISLLCLQTKTAL